MRVHPAVRRPVADRLLLGADGDPPAIRHGVPRVHGQVQDGQFQLRRVGADRAEHERKAGLDRNGRLQRALEKVRHAAHQLRHVDRNGLQLLLAREGQHALGQGGAPLRRVPGVVDEPGDVGPVAEVPPGHFEAADHRGQQVVEIMRDAAGQLAERVHLLRLEERRLRLLERLLRLPPLGEVACDLGEADQPPGPVTHRVDHHVGPEPAAVLADPPAFRLETALRLGGAQRPLRQAGLPVLVGVETREMLAEDLAGDVALGAAGRPRSSSRRCRAGSSM